MNADLSHHERAAAVARQQEIWRKSAPVYDRVMGFWERVLFRDARSWACAKASGDVLEIAVGTALNLTSYPHDTALTGVDVSPEMLALARERADRLGRPIDLQEGDAHDLAFADAVFDTVVCTFSLCNIPDQRRALAEMHRVLKPGGLLVLTDHVASTNRVALAVQRGLERLSLRFSGEHLTRRPFPLVVEAGFVVETHERYSLGIVELLSARKPSS